MRTKPSHPSSLRLRIETGCHGGESVGVEGSWDNWTTRQPLHKSGRDFSVVKLLPPGVYQYKFIVDGQWQYAVDQPAMYDEIGNVNNVLEVQEYVAENLDGIQGFQPPESPASSYVQPPVVSEDFAKEPSYMPPHLQLTLLNVPPSLDTPSSLPRPQHVILNHVYLEKSRAVWGATVLGTTHRYRSKYITCIMYKPKIAKPNDPAEAEGVQGMDMGSGHRMDTTS